MNTITDNININNMKKVISPKELIGGLELDIATAEKIRMWRNVTADIIHKQDNRVLTVVGPCSIHDTKQALDYAKKLKEIEDKFPNLFIVMRTYFEKPRTTIGWKGLINDPHLNGSFDIEEGLKKARELLLEISKMGLPVSTEFLDPISPQYIGDLITWGAIGARTTESQIHRELASGLSAAVGFKNGTDGTVQIAVDAIGSASKAHNFLGVGKDGCTELVETSGNPNTHIILRGGNSGPNYNSENVADVSEKLEKAGINTGIMIDASHANSNKDHNRQMLVIEDVAKQIKSGNKDITGIMIESHINAGSQAFTAGVDDPSILEYGVSITDKCVDFETTEEMLEILDKAAGDRKNI